MFKKLFIVFLAFFTLSACGKKSAPAPTPTPAPKLVEIPASERPDISLIPREDGHMIFIRMNNIKDDITSIEYELLYTASDGTAEIEKGVGDTIKEISKSLERKALLGTESCTNGCKYKFDEGVNGGTLTVTFTNNSGQMYTFTTPFALASASQLKKTGEIKLPTENFSVKTAGKTAANDFYILMKNYKGGFNIFSHGSGALVGSYPESP